MLERSNNFFKKLIFLGLFSSERAVRRSLERFGGSFLKRRTGIEVGNVRDVPSVCFAVEDIE